MGSHFIKAFNKLIKCENGIFAKIDNTTVTTNTLLIEIEDSDEARSWVESKFDTTTTSTRSYVKKSDTQYYVTENNTDWTALFSVCEYLTKVIDGNVSNVTNMNGTFNICSNLTSVSLTDMHNVTNMRAMFAECESLTAVNLANTSNVTDMMQMFRGCKALETVELSDTGNVTNMSYMFSECESLKTVRLPHTENVIYTAYMFNLCTALTSVYIPHTEKVTRMDYMFFACNALTTMPELDISSVTDMTCMLHSTPMIQSGILDFYKTASTKSITVTEYTNCFRGCGIQGGDDALAERAHIPTTWGGAGAEMTISAEATVDELTASINYTITNGDYDTWTVTCEDESTEGITGAFTFNDLVPGTYEYTVTAICSHGIELSTKVSFTIEEQHTDFEIMIDEYTAGDKKITWSAENKTT